jgi:hypothetical protein
MVEERIKQFTGNPSPIEIVIEIMGLGDSDKPWDGITYDSCTSWRSNISIRSW